MTKQLIAKVKFWFGQEFENIFNLKYYDVEYKESFAYIYEKYDKNGKN